MKKLLWILTACVVCSLVTTSCGKDDWDRYMDYREENIQWYEEMKQKRNDDGTPYYHQLSPLWNAQSGVLIHYFNDRSKNIGNLTPLVTSYVDVKYIGRLYNDVAFDSSYNNTVNGDSIYRCQVSSNILGFQLALLDMRVGDTCEVIIPYYQAYGGSTTSSIPAYSNLKFNLKLVDIYRYEIP